jgi:acetylornithine aminotransferase
VTSINFGMGDPREETPLFIREAMKAACRRSPATPPRPACPSCARPARPGSSVRYGLGVDPERHVLPANGTKESVYTLAFALIGPWAMRDTVIIPTPAYPVYETARGTRGPVCTSLRFGARTAGDSTPTASRPRSGRARACCG